MLSQLLLLTPAQRQRYHFPIKPLDLIINFISTNRANPGIFDKRMQLHQQKDINILFELNL
jgi:hypothetical protein